VRALQRPDHPDEQATRIALATDGAPGAREALAREWTPRIYRVAWRMLGNEQDASEATQDVMMRVLNALHRYDPSRNFSTWVYAIARNACIDEQRRRVRRPTPAERDERTDPAPLPFAQVAASRRAERVREALDALPPKYREVLVLYHFEHLKYVEIAEALDMPLGTVMNRIFRARRRMRDLLGPEDAP